MRVAAARVYRYDLPFTRPVTTAKGRFSSRRGFLVALQDQEGRTGWGDAAPWPGFAGSHAANRDDRVRQTLLDLSARTGPLVGSKLESLEQIEAWLHDRSGSLPSEALHAVELALLDLVGQERMLPVARLLGPSRANQVAVSAVASDPASAIRAVSAGVRTLKVKVGSTDVEADARRLEAIRAAVGEAVRLRADRARWGPKPVGMSFVPRGL